jgi:hypothetical protein
MDKIKFKPHLLNFLHPWLSTAKYSVYHYGFKVAKLTCGSIERNPGFWVAESITGRFLGCFSSLLSAQDYFITEANYGRLDK